MTAIPKDPEKVDRILKSAMHNFAIHGYRATKTDVIAQEADVSKGIIFRYYGSKAELFVTALQQATNKLQSVADYSVWRGAHDLVDMIVRATKYKIELELEYPDEFGILINGYVSAEKAPSNAQQAIKKIYANATNNSIEQLVSPVLDQLSLREDVERQTIFVMMNAVMEQIQKETKVFMKNHPHAKLNEFTEIIDNAKKYVSVLENGILK